SSFYWYPHSRRLHSFPTRRSSDLEAARSLGASWFDVMWRIIVPNISNAILNATLLSVALVLGEYTIANNLLYNNLQVELVHLGRSEEHTSELQSQSNLVCRLLLEK